MDIEVILEDLKARVQCLEPAIAAGTSLAIAPSVPMDRNLEYLYVVTAVSSDKNQANYFFEFLLSDVIAVASGEGRFYPIGVDGFRYLSSNALEFSALLIIDGVRFEIIINNVSAFLNVLDAGGIVTYDEAICASLRSYDDWILIASSFIAGRIKEDSWYAVTDRRDRLIEEGIARGDFTVVEGSVKVLKLWFQDCDPSNKKTWVDNTCVFSAKSNYLRCAVNPSGPCLGCPHRP